MAEKAAMVPEVASAAPAGSVAGEVVLGGNTLVMLENDKMFALAIQRPRDEDQILKDLLAVVKRSQTFADLAIYEKPVGREFNPETGQYDGEMKHATGLSVRAMEECRRLYGNNGVAITVTGDTPEGLKLAGVFLDYERGTRFVMEKIASRSFKTRKGAVMLYPPDKYTDLVVPKNVSVLFRETVSRSLPVWMKTELEAAVQAKRSKVKPDIRRKRILASFTEIEVSQAHIEDYTGKKLNDMKHPDLNVLQGVLNAIRDGEVTVEECFGIKPKGAAGKKDEPGLKVKGQPEKEPEGSPKDEGGGLIEALGAAMTQAELDSVWNTKTPLNFKNVDPAGFALASEAYKKRAAELK